MCGAGQGILFQCLLRAFSFSACCEHSLSVLAASILFQCLLRPSLPPPLCKADLALQRRRVSAATDCDASVMEVVELELEGDNDSHKCHM